MSTLCYYNMVLYYIECWMLYRSPDVPMPTPKSKLSGIQSQVSGRRSKQARARAMKMRKMYGLDRVSVMTLEALTSFFACVDKCI